MNQYHVQIRNRLFSISSAPLQAGWGTASIGDTELSVSGKQAPGCAALLFLGFLIASMIAKDKTINLPYSEIVDVNLDGKKVTIKFQEEGKDKELILLPYEEKGFFGGKGLKANEFASKLREKCAA